MNKPVAWIIQSKYGTPALVWNGEPIEYNAISAKQPDIPLYTHPVKELTDEEIIELFDHPDDFNCIDFAKAILRKAQEK